MVTWPSPVSARLALLTGANATTQAAAVVRSVIIGASLGASGGASEVQIITLTSAADDLDGTFTVDFSESGPLSVDTTRSAP